MNRKEGRQKGGEGKSCQLGQVKEKKNMREGQQKLWGRVGSTTFDRRARCNKKVRLKGFPVSVRFCYTDESDAQVNVSGRTNVVKVKKQKSRPKEEKRKEGQVGRGGKQVSLGKI